MYGDEMNKKLAHAILFLGDIFCIWGLWIGYHEFHRILSEIAHQAEIIRYGNRVGFLILGLFLPPIHLLTLVEHYWPDLIHNYKRFLNRSTIVAVIALIVTGYFGSTWITSKIENGGYVYCRDASGSSALAKSLVYAKNRDICADLATGKKVP